jgi:hypothetical protein
MVAMLSTMAAFLIALTPGPARAADCGLLGTSCVTDTVEQTAGGAVSTVQETVDDTVDDVVTVVDETVDQVVAVVEETVDTVKKTTDKVVDTVDDTVDNVDDTVNALDPVAPPPAEGHSEQGANNPSGSGSRPNTEPAVVRPDRSNRSAPTLEEVALVSGTSPASDTIIVTGTASTSPFDLLGPLSLPEVARALAFPLVLVGLVLGFVAVQNRLDRKDPKLALATTTPDVLTFE